MSKSTTTNGSNGTNGHNGHGTSNAAVLEALHALAQAITVQVQPPAPPPVATAPVPKVRKPRAPRAPKADPAPLARTAVGPDHVCSVYTILESHVPLAANTVSKRPGAGLIVRGACICGRVWTGEIPAADLEVMAQTGYWEGEG